MNIFAIPLAAVAHFDHHRQVRDTMYLYVNWGKLKYELCKCNPMNKMRVSKCSLDSQHGRHMLCINWNEV